MSKINFDIALYRSPYFENLVEELYRISIQKRSIYKKIKTEDDYKNKLSFEERGILNHITDCENKILIEIISYKDWFTQSDGCLQKLKHKLGIKPNIPDKEEYDIYPVNIY